MKASLLFVAGLAMAISSIAVADAAPAKPDGAVTRAMCSGTSWPHLSTCRNVYNYRTYVDCLTAGQKMGWGHTESNWYCSSLGLKQ